MHIVFKAPTNSRIFDYSFVNLLFNKENGSQIFGGGASRWLMIMITPACSQHGESRWLKTYCHSAQGGSQFERMSWKLWPTEDDWTPSWRKSRAVTPPVWRPARCRRCQNPAADIGVTEMSMEDYYMILRWPDEDSPEESSAWPLVSESTAMTTRLACRKPLSMA